ncbi:hypothetical protein FACS1894199_14170 [Bacteroidia bacterium]|nr:hypothetical protein FACS1894199_14170 [Bacteroidia bacterium]
MCKDQDKINLTQTRIEESAQYINQIIIIMTNNVMIAAVAACMTGILMFSACQDDEKNSTVEPTVEPKLVLSKKSISVSSAGGNDTVFLTSNVDWTATGTETWCGLSQTAGDGNADQAVAVVFTVKANSTEAVRTANVTFSAGELSETVKVEQKAFAKFSWTLNSGVLTISGDEAMPDYEYQDTPWYSQSASITTVIIENGVTSLGQNAFNECSALTSVTIPNSVTSIGDAAFGNCSSLAEIAIPNSVTSIGFASFGLCSNLTSVTIPNSVTSIGQSAFMRCSSLTSVTIPNSVTSIGNMAFWECRALTSVTCLNPTPPTLELGVFSGISNSCTFYVPAGSVSAYEAAGWGSYGTVVAI